MPTPAYLQKVFQTARLYPGLDLLRAGGDNRPVITCTRCGEKNSDDTRFCTRCNRKLQSSLRAAPADTRPGDEPLEGFRHRGVPDDVWLAVRRMIEAWAYLLILAGVGAACWWYRTWWPLYPTVGLLGLLIWLRRI